MSAPSRCTSWSSRKEPGAAEVEAGGSGLGDQRPPRWRTALGLQHQRPLPFGSVYSRIDWTWQSSQLSAASLDPRSYEPAYSLVNARLGLKTDNGLDLSVWGKNIFDQVYDVQAGDSYLFGPTDPAYLRFLGSPREYGVTLRKSF